MTKAAEEQDQAAGGAEFRKLRLTDGTVVTASVSVQVFPKGHQHWAYLRFKTGGKNTRRYLGKVTADTRQESLALGWKMAQDARFLAGSGWSWVTAPRRRRATASN